MKSRRLLLVIVALIASCAPAQTDIGDGGLFSGVPCGPPCFWNITPGKTTEAEAKHILTEVLRLVGCREFNNESISGLRGISACGNRVGISFRHNSDIVEIVSFNPSETVTVGDVVDRYGPPEWVSVTPSGLPERPKSAMVIHFDAFNATLSLGVQVGLFTVSSSSPIEAVGYSDDEAYALSRQYSVKWRGYGTYEYSINEAYAAPPSR
jgi:hypothetical protein